MENFGKFTTLILTLFISPIINGFVFVKLWLWFIIPTFSAQELRLVEAIGVCLLIGFVTNRKNKKTKEEEKEDFWKGLLKNLANTISIALIFLAAGWIVNQFM